jgi:hypothetical protein
MSAFEGRADVNRVCRHQRLYVQSGKLWTEKHPTPVLARDYLSAASACSISGNTDKSSIEVKFSLRTTFIYSEMIHREHPDQLEIWELAFWDPTSGIQNPAQLFEKPVEL